MDRRGFLAVLAGALGGAVLAGDSKEEGADRPTTRYLTIRKYSIAPENVAEVMKRVREGFLPIVTKIEGFVAYDAFDAGGGVMLFLNVFTTKESAAAATKAAAEWGEQHLAGLGSKRTDVFEGLVTVHAAAG